MKRPLILVGLALAAPLALGGCTNHMNAGYGMGWYSSPYSVWYDGYYGPFYDGYWGNDGDFYYRLSRDGDYRRADGGHFRRERPHYVGRDYHGNRDRGDHRNFRHFEGHTRHPAHGMMPPHYPSHGRNDRGHDRDGH